jgi:EmrB/QacA subfamily drug resistance transporter
MVAAINLAIPKLAASGLHPSSTDLVWIVDVYVLAFGCLLIPAGAWGDRHGRRRALEIGLAVFVLGNVVSAVAGSVAVLLAGRAISGVGAALVMPATLSISVSAHPPERRAHAVAIWTAATGIGGTVGNVLGGAILQALNWWALFALMVPVGLALLAWVVRVVPVSMPNPATVDSVGTVGLIALSGALLYAIIEGPELGWGSVRVLGCFVLAAVLLVAFVVYERRIAHPVLDPRLFAIPAVRAGTLGIAAAFFGLFSLFFVNAQYMQYAKGLDPFVTGIAIVPLALGFLFVARRSVRWSARIGTLRMVAAGLGLVIVGLGLLSLADAGTPYPLYVGFLLIMALGLGLSTPSLSSDIIRSLPSARAGMGSGLNSAARELGSALGVAVIGTVLNTQFLGHVPAAVRGHARSAGEALAAATRLGPRSHNAVIHAFTTAMDHGYRVLAVALVFVAALVLYWLRESVALAPAAAPAR